MGTIEQSIVLASILAGFGLAIAAQISLASADLTDNRPIALEFMRSSLLSILSIFTAILYFTLIRDSPEEPLCKGDLRFAMVNASNLLLFAALWTFIRGISKLATEKLALERHWVMKYLVKASAVVFVIIATAMLLISLTGESIWRMDPE